MEMERKRSFMLTNSDPERLIVNNRIIFVYNGNDYGSTNA